MHRLHSPPRCAPVGAGRNAGRLGDHEAAVSRALVVVSGHGGHGHGVERAAPAVRGAGGLRCRLRFAMGGQFCGRRRFLEKLGSNPPCERMRGACALRSSGCMRRAGVARSPGERRVHDAVLQCLVADLERLEQRGGARGGHGGGGGGGLWASWGTAGGGALRWGGGGGGGAGGGDPREACLVSKQARLRHARMTALSWGAVHPQRGHDQTLLA